MKCGVFTDSAEARAAEVVRVERGVRRINTPKAERNEPRRQVLQPHRAYMHECCMMTVGQNMHSKTYIMTRLVRADIEARDPSRLAPLDHLVDDRVSDVRRGCDAVEVAEHLLDVYSRFNQV